MNTSQQAAQDLKVFGLRFQGVMALVSDLERIGSLEQMEQEIKGRASVAKAEADKACVHLEELLQQAQTAEAGIVDANEKASQIIAEANAAAQKVKDDAFAKAVEVENMLHQRKDVADAELAATESAISKLDTALRSKSAEYDALATRIAQLKDEARKALA